MTPKLSGLDKDSSFLAVSLSLLGVFLSLPRHPPHTPSVLLLFSGYQELNSGPWLARRALVPLSQAWALHIVLLSNAIPYIGQYLRANHTR